MIDQRAADLVNVKLAKCGGLGVARALLERARDAGLGTIVGSMMEGPIGVGAAASLVAAVGTTHVSDLDAAWWAASSPVTGGASYDAGHDRAARRARAGHRRPAPPGRPMTTVLRVGVPVATLWTSPERPRDLDAAAVGDRPTSRLAGRADAADRLGLHGRTLTQLLGDEPVLVVEEADDWSRVVAPWQPVPGRDGYDGWVPSGQLRASRDDDLDHPTAHVPADRIAVAAYAERFAGLIYLWGGTSPAGFDCSGLVHYCYRQAGVVVPRDSPARPAAVAPIPLGEEQPGDLYFFAREDGRIYHVGFATGRGRMLHAPERDGCGRDRRRGADRRAARPPRGGRPVPARGVPAQPDGQPSRISASAATQPVDLVLGAVGRQPDAQPTRLAQGPGGGRPPTRRSCPTAR